MRFTKNDIFAIAFLISEKKSGKVYNESKNIISLKLYEKSIDRKLKALRNVDVCIDNLIYKLKSVK